MTELPKSRGFQSPIDIRQRATADASKQRSDVTTSRTADELFVIIAISAIGILATLNLILRFPDLGFLIESYNKF